MYNEFGITALDGYNTPEAPKDKMDAFLDNIFAGAVGPDEARKLIKEATFLKPGAKKTIQFLIESGQFDVSAKASALGQAAKDLFTKGKISGISERLDAMKGAIKTSQTSGEMQFIFKSSDGWKSEGVSSYKGKLNGKDGINYLNQGLFFDVMRSGDPIEYFGKDTIELISVYLEARGWKSNLMQGKGTFETIDLKNKIPFLQEFATKKWEEEKKKVNPIFEGISKNFSNNPEIKKAIESIGINFGIPIKDGVFDVKEYKRQFLIKNESANDVTVMEAMKKDLTFFQEKSKGMQGKISQEKNIYEQKLGNKKTLSKFPEFEGVDFSVEENGKKISVKDISITNLKGKYATQILAQIGDKYKEKVPQELVNVILLLGLQIKEEQIIVGRASTNETIRAIKKGIQPNQEKISSAGEVARSRHHTENAKKATSNISDTEAWKQLQDLSTKEKKGTLSEDEITRLADLKQRRISTGELAQQYTLAKDKFGEEEAKRIFVESNQIVSNNPRENYDFKALEKIAILTDPESSPGQRAFARLEPGKTVSMQKLMEGEMQSSVISSPEIASMNVTMNASGGFDIPLLKETNLTKPQVQEYMTNIALYADLGLSQLIPHIPLITTELRNKGINTSIDGSTNTMEQQQVLKEIYGLLFGKKIETSSLGDVERAFVSSAGNPTSMKNAMQHTLKIHHLIGESGQAIAPDTLQKWIRGTQESTPNKADLLANIQ